MAAGAARRVRTIAVLTGALLVVLLALLAAERLHERALDARDTELRLTALRLDLAQIQDVPWGAAPSEGDDPAQVRDELADAQANVEGALERLDDADAVRAPFERGVSALWIVFDVVSKGGSPDDANEASSAAAHELSEADKALQRVSARYRADSEQALGKSRAQSLLVILGLFGAFAWFYARMAKARRTAERLAEEHAALVVVKHHEALTDALTGLGNRRALMAALDASRDSQSALALFDLNGFKQYNDRFGHPAGDALLTRLGERLATTIDGIGTAYRMGGDEFCVLAPADAATAHVLAGLAAAALTDEGDGYRIECAYGVALMPSDTGDPTRALALADQRMYAHKASAPRQFAS